MTTSVSVRQSNNHLHQSLSFDDRDQYYDNGNDDTLCMEYLNEVAATTEPTQKLHSKYIERLIVFDK